MDNPRKADDSGSFLDGRLEAATRSDDPEVIRNTITALVLLANPNRLMLLANLLRDVVLRLRREAPGDSRQYPLLMHAGQKIQALDAASLQILREEIEKIEDRKTSVAILALLPKNQVDHSNSLIWRWLAARQAWPSFRFLRLLGIAAGAAALAVLAMWLLLLGLAFASGSAANPWGLAELSVLLTIIVIASLSAVVSGWTASAGGTASFGQATMIFDSITWGVIASLLATFLLWVLPDQFPFVAWVRGGSGSHMARWLLTSWAFLFVATTGARWLSAWLVEHRPDPSRTNLVLLSAGAPACLVTLFIMLGLGGLHLLSGEMIGIWLLVVTLAFAVAAVSVAIETPASRIAVLRARGDKTFSLTQWVVAVTVALFLSIVARPLLTGAAAIEGTVTLDVPLPGARIVAVQPGMRLEVWLEGNTAGNFLLLVKNTKDASSTFAAAARLGGSIGLTTQGSSLVVCVLGVDNLTGGLTSPFCERPSLRWIADIFGASTSGGTRALVSIRQVPATPLDDRGLLGRSAIMYLTASTTQFSVSEPTTLYGALVGAPRPESGNPEDNVNVLIERPRADGYSSTVPPTRGGGAYSLQAGTYLLCARRPRTAIEARRRLPTLGLRQGTPSSYITLSGTPCDSPSLRSAPPGVGVVVVSIPDSRRFHDVITRDRSAIVATGGEVPIHVNEPTLLIADFQQANTTIDAMLLLARVATTPGGVSSQTLEGRADDPEELVQVLMPGDYRLCTNQFGMQGMESGICAPAGIGGTITYRLIPLASLPR